MPTGGFIRVTDSKIQPGTFVRHATKGVGRVGEQDNSGGVTVNFKNGERQQIKASVASNLKLLPNNGLAALTWNGPEEIRSWIDDAPLKLIAAAIADIGSSPKIGEIKNALQGQGKVFDADVKLSPTWWNRASQAAANDSRHFLAVRNKSNSITSIRLIGDVERVPAGPLPPRTPEVNPASLWKKWLNGETTEPPALTRPPKPPKSVSNALAKWPAKSIDKALHQTMQGVEDFLYSSSSSSQVAAAWLEALSRASMRWIECTWPDSGQRWIECTWPDSGQQLTERTAELIERLSEHTSPSGLSLFLSGALSGQLGAQRLRAYEEQLGQQQRQRDDYEGRLEQQRQEQERRRADYEERLERQRQEQERQRTSHASELEELRVSHAAELERERREQDRLQERIRAFSAQMASGREESRLEVRQGMLLAVGDALQRAYLQGKSAEDRLGNVIITLPNVLREGGAEALGIVGATVKYDPKLHYSAETIPGGKKVRLAAPGVVVGERVILKASVLTETEVC